MAALDDRVAVRAARGVEEEMRAERLPETGTRVRPVERPVLQFLAASRPERAGASAMAAAGASIGLHALLLVSATWATVAWAAGGHANPALATESYRLVDLLPPSALVDRNRAGAAADVVSRRVHRAVRSTAPAGRAARFPVFLDAPNAIPEVLPPPVPAVLASLHESEYGGMVSTADLSAAEILADHHDASADELAAGPPRLTSYTVGPELTNPAEVTKELTRAYPNYLQENGVGGRVLLWFLVDEQGKVRRWLLKQSSGHRTLDKVALRVAAKMRFRPAVNYDRPVAVWVALPVVFRIAEG